MKTIQIKVIGRVQGVGFRYYTKKRATEFKINGFVQNKPDGSVYIEAQADQSDLKTFVDWLKKGPAWARVSEVKVSEMPSKEFHQFEIR
jgi:acylphosphatase